MNSHTALCKESSLYNDIDELARNVDLFHDVLAVDLRCNATVSYTHLTLPTKLEV